MRWFKVRKHNGRYHYPFASMTPGDHFAVPRRLAKKAASAAWMYGHRHGLRFTCREFGSRGRMRITAKG